MLESLGESEHPFILSNHNDKSGRTVKNPSLEGLPSNVFSGMHHTSHDPVL